MARRYIAKRDVFIPVKGQKRFFQAEHPGYTKEQMRGVTRDQQKAFFRIEDVEDVIEQATAAPGEKRAVSRFECDECEFVAASAGGLGSHQRVHEDE